MGSLLWARLDRLVLEREGVVWRARLGLVRLYVDGPGRDRVCRVWILFWLLGRGDCIWRGAVVKLLVETLSMRRRARPVMERRIVEGLGLGWSVNSIRSSCFRFQELDRGGKLVLGDCVGKQLRGALELGRWCWWESCGGRTKSSTSLGAQDNQFVWTLLHGFLHSQAANKTNINDVESIITFRFGQLKSALNTEYQDIIHITLHCTKGHHNTGGQTAPARGKESSLFPAYPAVNKEEKHKSTA